MQETPTGMMTRRDALARLGLLVGGTLSAPLVSGVLAGCRATPAGEAFTPQTLSADLYELVGTLTEIIIPTTDTPGARDAGVPAFIDRMLTTWYPEADRAAILAGLRRLDERATEAYGTKFNDADPAQQTGLVEAMARQAYTEPAQQQEPQPERPEVAQEQEANEPANASEPNPDPLPDELPAFFRSLKELTVVGYYTSEVGATQELRVMPMGEYRGDIPYQDVGRAWS